MDRLKHSLRTTPQPEQQNQKMNDIPKHLAQHWREEDKLNQEREDYVYPWPHDCRAKGISPMDWIETQRDSLEAVLDHCNAEQLKQELNKWVTLAVDAVRDGEQHHSEAQRSIDALDKIRKIAQEGHPEGFLWDL
jgi:hypothetical protein